MKRSPESGRAPWWTEADQAEFDALLYRLVGAGLAHRDCATCAALNAWCGPMREAAETFLDWLRGRQLLSRAEWLRERQAA